MRATGRPVAALPLLLLLLSGSAAASRVSIPIHAQLPPGTKLVEGVPVHSYNLLFQRRQRSHSEARQQGGAVAAEETTTTPTEQLLLDIHDEVTDEKLHDISQAHQNRIGLFGHANGIKFMEFRGSEQDLEELLRENSGVVQSVEPDLLCEQTDKAEEELNDRLQGQSISPINVETEECFPNLERIGVYSTKRTGRGVHVYVLDTGIRHSHTEFESRAIPEFQVSAKFDEQQFKWVSEAELCEVNSDSCARDWRGHGTHVAGTVAAKNHGVAPESIIHAIKVLNDEGQGPESWLLAGLDHVIRNRRFPAVVSLSLGVPVASAPLFSKAVDKVIGSGVSVVTSSGNRGTDACDYAPANVQQVITVGSSTVQDRVSLFSNFGACVDLFAPGEDIISLVHWSNQSTTERTGTSMSCPHVAGAAALILQGNPSLPPFEVKRRIVNDARAGKLKGDLLGAPNLRLSVDPEGNELCPKHQGMVYARWAMGSVVLLVGPALYASRYS